VEFAQGACRRHRVTGDRDGTVIGGVLPVAREDQGSRERDERQQETDDGQPYRDAEIPEEEGLPVHVLHCGPERAERDRRWKAHDRQDRRVAVLEVGEDGLAFVPVQFLQEAQRHAQHGAVAGPGREGIGLVGRDHGDGRARHVGLPGEAVDRVEQVGVVRAVDGDRPGREVRQAVGFEREATDDGDDDPADDQRRLPRQQPDDGAEEGGVPQQGQRERQRHPTS